MESQDVSSFRTLPAETATTQRTARPSPLFGMGPLEIKSAGTELLILEQETIMNRLCFALLDSPSLGCQLWGRI
jgi:hypothetical protein